MKLSPRHLLLSLLFLPLFFLSSKHSLATVSGTAEVFYSEACSDCRPYLEKILTPALSREGINLTVKDYIGNPNFRVELSQRIEQAKIPQEMIGHMMTFLEPMTNPSTSLRTSEQPTTIILAGHVPEKLIGELFDEKAVASEWKTLVVWQDQMHGEVKSYKLWATGGQTETYSVDVPLNEAIRGYQAGQTPLVQNRSLLSAVIISGFLDGLNPCAFAILLFLVAFIFMLKKSRLSVLKYSLVYIGAIYLTYLLIGLGIWKAVLFTSTPHFMAKVGSTLVIVLGTINILNYFFPKFPISLRISMPGRQKILELMHKGTLPSTLVLGILVGFCTFPCSGGIYVAIVTLLAVKTTFILGFVYLLIYNLMFVLPLFILLALAGNRMTVEKLTNLEEQNEPRMRLIYGLTMIATGVVILLFFI